MKQARCTQPAIQIDFDGLFELSMQEMNDVCGGANSRSYSGPTEVVAPDATCSNGLAPNPFKHSCS
jgi:hypothetical protein